MKYCSYPIWFTLLLVYGLSVQAANIDSRVSRNPVAINESFQLILQTEDTPDGEPDFSPLTRDFDILNQRQRENIKMIDGEFSRSIGWTVTLIPRRAGTLEIPQIQFGTDRSQAIQLTVGENPQDRQEDTSEDILLRLTAEPKTPYIQQQVVLTLHIYQGVGLSNTNLSQPRTNDPEIQIRRLGPDRRYEEQVDGRRYLVMERRYTLFPQKPGTLTIDPVMFQGELMAPGASGNRFSDTPMRGFGSNREVRRARSDSLTLEVRPIPGEFRSPSRLPAVASGIRPPLTDPAGPGMSATPEQETSRRSSVSASSHLPWLLALLVSVCVLACLAWWFRGRDKSTIEPPAEPKSTAPRKTQGIRGKRLKQACLANDAEAAGKELLVWASGHWPNAPPTALNTLAGCFAGSDAEREIKSLERYLYAAKKGKWDGRPLWQAVKDLITEQGDTIGEEALIT